MSLKSRLLNKSTKAQNVQDDAGYDSLSCNIDILNYFENNPEVSSISIYDPNKIYVEKNGVLAKSEMFLPEENSVKKIIESIANKYDIIINPQNPCFNINLAKGVKINAIVPPMSDKKAFLSIRRIAKPEQNINKLIDENVLSNEIVLFLKECLKNRLNIFVTGSAYVSKVNVLNTIANLISLKDSVITIESSPQVKVRNDCLLSLIKYRGFFNKVLKKAIKLNHNRIVISDVDTSELLDVFDYINAGYSGFLASFSAKSYEDTVASVQNAITLAHPNFAPQNAASLITSSIDILVYISKMEDGTEKITHIGEFAKDNEGIKLKDIFVWKSLKTRNKGYHYSTGYVSKHFNTEGLYPSGLLEKYFSKDYKHNYIVDKSKVNLKEKISMAQEYSDSAIKKRIKSYKTLEGELKNIVKKDPKK